MYINELLILHSSILFHWWIKQFRTVALYHHQPTHVVVIVLNDYNVILPKDTILRIFATHFSIHSKIKRCISPTFEALRLDTFLK